MRLKGRKLRIAKERFSVYTRFNTQFRPRDFLAGDSIVSKPDPEGYSVLEAFYIVETFGAKPEEVPCVKPLPLLYAHWGKMQLNWQIEQWAESYGEWTLFEWELREWYPWFPEWVFDAVLKQGEPIKLANMIRQYEEWKSRQ